MATYTLWCDTFDSTNIAWTEVNNTPYLQDTDTDYITATDRTLTEGFFEFAPSGDPGTNIIDSVVLYLESMQNAGGDEFFETDLQATGVVLTDLGDMTPNVGAYSYQTWNVSVLLNTWTKIDTAEIQFISRRTGGTFTPIFIRRAYLLVTYHSPPSTITVKRTLDRTVRHNRRSGTIQYIRFPSAPY